MEELTKYLRALVLLQLQSMSAETSPTKPEFLLSRAGLSRREIADLLNKSEAAVAKGIERARQGRPKLESSQEGDENG